MTTDNLRDELAALPGVASAEVTIPDDQRPIARVWLDGTKAGTEVRELVDVLLGRAVPPQPEEADQTSRRRSGLGRGLDDLLPSDGPHPVPMQFQPDAGQRSVIARVAVIETGRGVSVEVEDSKGRCATVPVGSDGSIDSAVVCAIREVLGLAEATDLHVEDLEATDGPLVVATAVQDNRRTAGAAFIEFGRPSAVARAVFQALTDL